MKKQTLWSKDFTIITIGTIISAIGGTAMNFALSLVVFDHTNSTMLTGVFAAVSMLPSMIVPLLAAPFIDASDRKKIIVFLDAFDGILYILFAIFLWMNSFSYIAYMLFSVVVTTAAGIYSLAYSSLYPDLIPKGFAQKGYSISSMIYPTVTALITPIASLIYVNYGIAYICLGEGILLLLASFAEHCISYQDIRKKMRQKFSIRTYKEDIVEGFTYLKKEKGIRSIYSYMSFTSGNAESVSMMSMAHFQTSPILSTTMYAFLTTAETAGRMLGSIVHYFIKIPDKKRYNIAVSVYALYESFDVILLFLSYPLMIINRFICGFLGVNSANIREASVQNYLPSDIRARINSFFNVFIAIISVCFRFICGLLGEVLPYPYVSAIFGIFGLLCVYVCIVRNRKVVKEVYNQQI